MALYATVPPFQDPGIPIDYIPLPACLAALAISQPRASQAIQVPMFEQPGAPASQKLGRAFAFEQEPETELDPDSESESNCSWSFSMAETFRNPWSRFLVAVVSGRPSPNSAAGDSGYSGVQLPGLRIILQRW